MNLLSSTNNGQISGGGAIKKVLAFAAEWSVSSEQSKSYNYWEQLIYTHFLETSHLRYTMLSIQGKHPRTFDLPFAFLPRFFHVQYTSGLISSHLSLNHANEYLLPSGDLLVDAPLVLVTQVFEVGVISTMLAQLRVILREWYGCWKIEFWDFIARQYEESIPRSLLFSHFTSSSTSTPSSSSSSTTTPLTPSSSTLSLNGSTFASTASSSSAIKKESTSLDSIGGITVPGPVASEYGLSMKCIRTMEIAEMVHYMRDIIQYAHVKKVSASESLKKIAAIAELSQNSNAILTASQPTPTSVHHHRTLSSEFIRPPSPIALSLMLPMKTLPVSPTTQQVKKGGTSRGTSKRKVGERKKKERKKPTPKGAGA